MILDIFSFVKEILYINSSLYPDRLQNLADQFAKIGINIKTDSRCKKIEAYYPLENEIPIFFKGKIGHYGCIVSHSMAYKYIAESSYSDNNNYLIVEDDITINNNFLFIFNSIIKDIKKSFDIFYLHNTKNQTIPLQIFDSGLLKISEPPKLTHAYIISSGFHIYEKYFYDLKKLLNECNCRHHIDIILKDYIKFTNLYASRYPLITQNRKKFKSSIIRSKKI